MYYYDKDPHQFSLLPFLANLLFPLASLETDHTLDGDPPPILPNPADPHSTSQKNHLATSTEVELARSKQAVQLTPCHGKEQQLTPCRRWWRRRSWPPRRRRRARCGAWRSTSPSRKVLVNNAGSSAASSAMRSSSASDGLCFLRSCWRGLSYWLRDPLLYITQNRKWVLYLGLPCWRPS